MLDRRKFLNTSTLLEKGGADLAHHLGDVLFADSPPPPQAAKHAV